MKSAPRILFVLGAGLEIGGAERQLAMLLPALCREAFNVHLLCLGEEGALAADLREQGVPVSALSQGSGSGGALRRKFFALRVAFAMRAFVARLHPDIVHFFAPRSYAIGGLALLGLPDLHCVMSRRCENHYLSGRPWSRGLERFLHRRMSAVLGNSATVVRDLLEEGAPMERIGLIHNAVQGASFGGASSRQAARERLGIPRDALLIVCVANLWPYKGHADLLNALAGARLPHEWRLLLVGRDEGVDFALRAQAQRLGIAGKVCFLGSRDDVPTILAASDIGVSPSHQEGLPNAVLEYLAAGLATLVTDAGGSAEAVGEAALIVPPRDPVALRVAIESLVDGENREMLRAAARARAAQFSLRRCVDAHMNLYRGLLEAGTVPESLQVSPACAAGAASTTRGAHEGSG